MDFAAFEYDRTFVIEALRRGAIDYLENISEAEEADLFRHLLGRVWERLAEHYPTPRQKEEVPICLRSLKLFDAEGLFLGDASYVFVPDNENYEDSVKLLFDEHNHPVNSQEVDLPDPRYQWRRCYKVVSLIHVNRELNLFLT